MREIPKKMKPKRAGGVSTNKLAVATLIVAICVGLALSLVFMSGGDKDVPGKGVGAQTNEDEAAGAQGSTASQSTATGQVQGAPTIEQVIVPPLSVYRSRNPFEPLVNMDEAVARVTYVGGAQPPQEPEGAGVPGVVEVPPELTRPNNAGDSVISRVITLLGVFEQGGKMFARIRVADQLFEKVGVGDDFADSYKLLALGKDSSATILYGDERFTIFVGQSIYL